MGDPARALPGLGQRVGTVLPDQKLGTVQPNQARKRGRMPVEVAKPKALGGQGGQAVSIGWPGRKHWSYLRHKHWPRLKHWLAKA